MWCLTHGHGLALGQYLRRKFATGCPQREGQWTRPEVLGKFTRVFVPFKPRALRRIRHEQEKRLVLGAGLQLRNPLERSLGDEAAEPINRFRRVRDGTITLEVIDHQRYRRPDFVRCRERQLHDWRLASAASAITTSSG